jgi:DNA-binding response OmpR family regulator
MTDSPPKKRVLLVEDEVLIAALAVDALEEIGYAVAEATTAKAALDLATADPAGFDLAIVDLGLPDMPGDELVVQLRALRADFPVIVATGYGAKAMEGKLQGQQAMTYLSKPYDYNALAAAIRSLDGAAV